MSDFKLDKAFMAVKAQRYDEALEAYESALQENESVEGWTGLGVTKLFQLLGNQTMEEVVFCFNKARNIEGADTRAIELQLISYSALVAEQATSYCISLIKEIEKAQGEALAATIIAGVAGGLASNNRSLGGSIVSGSVAAASAGVAVGRLGDIANAKAARELVLETIADIHLQVTNYLTVIQKSEEAIAFSNRIQELQNLIAESSTAKSSGSNAWYNTNWIWFWLILFWPVAVYGFILRMKNKS